jgi:hypothetical protein
MLINGLRCRVSSNSISVGFTFPLIKEHGGLRAVMLMAGLESWPSLRQNNLKARKIENRSPNLAYWYVN